MPKTFHSKGGRFTNWIFGPVFCQKKSKTLADLLVFFSFVITSMGFRYAKKKRPKSDEGVCFGTQYMGV